MKKLVSIFLLLPLLVRADLASDVAAWTSGPYVVFVGDSLTMGYDQYSTWWCNGSASSGDTNYDITSVLWSNSTHVVTSTNIGCTGRVWADVQPDGDIVQGLSYKPKYLFVRLGVNDVAGNNVWEDEVLPGMNYTALKCSQSNVTLVIQSIMPWTAGDDTSALLLRTWNTNLQVWVATNSGVKWIDDHDLFGQTRVSTGFKDDLITSYQNPDGTHLKPPAYILWSSIVITNLTNWLPPDASTVGAIRGQVRFSGSGIIKQ